MKKTIKTVALFLGMSLAAASCQKENVVEIASNVESTEAYISVTYFVDGIAMHATFNDESSWQEFLHQMFALAEEGHRVRFGSSNASHGLIRK